MRKEHKRIPWFLFPFWFIWRFITGIMEFTGRVTAIVLGFALMVAGILVSATIVGLFIGLPMVMIGILLVLRSLF
ncbi:MAG: hypothetical protein N3D16_09910 [Anaerolineales bacterium]|nr:hypothetical protein [Anaerolineales bacterium]